MKNCCNGSGIVLKDGHGLIVAELCQACECQECHDGWVEEGRQIKPCPECGHVRRACESVTFARVPVRYLGCSLGAFPHHPAKMQAHGEACALAEGAQVWLWGPADVGKTGLLVAGLMAGSMAGRRYRYVSWIDVVSSLQLNAFDVDKAAWNRLVNFKAHLVLDDVEPSGAQADHRLIELVRRRSDRRRLVSIGTRLTVARLRETLRGHTSRLAEPVEVGGPPIGDDTT